MEAGTTTDLRSGDAEINQLLDGDSRECSAAKDRQERRQARIDDFEELSLRREHHYAAMMGGGAADFQRLQNELVAALLAEVNAREDKLQAFAEYRPELKAIVQLHAAIQFDLQLMNDPAYAEDSQSSLQLGRANDRRAAKPAGLIRKQWSVPHQFRNMAQ